MSRVRFRVFVTPQIVDHQTGAVTDGVEIDLKLDYDNAQGASEAVETLQELYGDSAVVDFVTINRRDSTQPGEGV